MLNFSKGTPHGCLPMGRQIIFSCNPPRTDTSACEASHGQIDFACELPGTDRSASKAPHGQILPLNSLGQTPLYAKHPTDRFGLHVYTPRTDGFCLLKSP